jgi:hypothetical protein
MAFVVRWLRPARAQFDALQEAAREAGPAGAKGKQGKSSKQQGLFKQVFKTIDLLATNPRHPGLRTHEYHSIENPFDAKQKVFEAYAQNRTPGAYRVFWCYGPESGQITIIAITPHP